MACKMTHVAGQNDFTLDIQAIGNLKPAVNDGLAGFKQLGARRIVKRASQHELLGDVGYAFADDVRCAALPRAVNRIASLSLVTSAYHAGRGVGSDALLSHEPRKVLAPRAQHRLIYVQSPALLAFGFDDHMDVGMLLIGV